MVGTWPIGSDGCWMEVELCVVDDDVGNWIGSGIAVGRGRMLAYPLPLEVFAPLYGKLRPLAYSSFLCEYWHETVCQLKTNRTEGDVPVMQCAMK